MDLRSYALDKFKHAITEQKDDTKALFATVSTVYEELEVQDSDLRAFMVQTWCDLGAKRAADLQETEYLDFVVAYPTFHAAVQLYLLGTPQRNIGGSEVCSFRCYHCGYANSVSTTVAKTWEYGTKRSCLLTHCQKEVIVTLLEIPMRRPGVRYR